MENDSFCFDSDALFMPLLFLNVWQRSQRILSLLLHLIPCLVIKHYLEVSDNLCRVSTVNSWFLIRVTSYRDINYEETKQCWQDSKVNNNVS
jgi:hypothetical protein